MPLNFLVDDLILARAIEDQRGAAAVAFHLAEQVERGLARQEIAQMRGAVFRSHQGAVIHDHGQGAGNLLGDGPGEVEAASGDESDFDAASAAAWMARRLASGISAELFSSVPSKSSAIRRIRVAGVVADEWLHVR